jgi:uroporphyrin-III C-methyltransferase
VSTRSQPQANGAAVVTTVNSANQATLGTVYLVGAGPGAPDLLTLRAARLLAQAGIVFHDALVHPQTLALAPHAIKVAVGKRCGRLSTAQAFINKRLIDATRTHRTVVRLKGGDPVLFGRAQEELDALNAAGIACEVVPGITAALAASADLKVSLTRRAVSRSVVFVTPRVGTDEAESDWVAPLLAADTGVIYMGAAAAQTLARTLIARGKAPATPVVIRENASGVGFQHVTTLKRLQSEILPTLAGPVLIAIGEVYRELLAASLANINTDIALNPLSEAA